MEDPQHGRTPRPQVNHCPGKHEITTHGMLLVLQPRWSRMMLHYIQS